MAEIQQVFFITVTTQAFSVEIKTETSGEMFWKSTKWENCFLLKGTIKKVIIEKRCKTENFGWNVLGKALNENIVSYGKVRWKRLGIREQGFLIEKEFLSFIFL